MSFKAYFDGAGEADRKQYKSLTLGALSGSGVQWDHFTEQWNRNLSSHRAPFLHTTDALALAPPFSKENGWSKESVRELINGCVTVLERCATTRSRERFLFIGIRPVTVTVFLDDFRRALDKFPDIGSVEHTCVTLALAYCHAWGIFTGYAKIQLFFDQGEHFRGHIVDRVESKRVKKDSPGLSNIVHIGESDMREVPALQVADLLAWAVNSWHRDKRVTHDWQRRLLAIDREREVFDYARLCKPNLDNLKVVKSWKLPTRKKLS